MSPTFIPDEFVSFSPYCLGEMSKKTKVLGDFFKSLDTYELVA